MRPPARRIRGVVKPVKRQIENSRAACGCTMELCDLLCIAPNYPQQISECNHESGYGCVVECTSGVWAGVQGFAVDVSI